MMRTGAAPGSAWPVRLALSGLLLACQLLLLAGCREEDQPAAVVAPRPGAPAPIMAPIGAAEAPRLPEALGPNIAVNPALDLFSRALYALDQKQRGRVEILQLGDSHTAADVMSGRLRTLFQQRFGSAGRGLLPVGSPYAGYRPTQVKVGESGRWSYENSFGSSATGPFGLTGFISRTRGPDGAATLESQDPLGFDEIAVEFLVQPGGGAFSILVDGRVLQRAETEGPAIQATRISLSVPSGSRQLTLRAEDAAPVAFLSWTTERRQGGVIYDSEGISGATVNIIDRWSPEIVRSEIRRRDPSLVILAFGTNEGFGRSIDGADYGAGLRAKIATLRAEAPRAAVLIVEPPDGNRPLPRPARCVRTRHNDCRHPPPPSFGFGLAACRAATPGGLAQVREAQTRVALDEQIFAWDWSQLMGTPCGIHNWTQTVPPLAREDHIHLTREGYEASGDALFKVLMAQYEQYRAVAAAQPRIAAAEPRK